MKIKFHFAFLLFICCSVNLFSQTSNWLWASASSSPSTSSGDECYAVSVDPSGNIFTGGMYYGNYINFGSQQITNTDVSGASFDAYIAKYDANGNVIWAKSVGDNDENLCYALATDLGGNVFLSGSWQSDSISFDTTTLYTTNYSQNIFIVKYNTNGDLLWARSAYSNQGFISYSMSTDAGGNIYVTGTFNGAFLTFGSDTITNTGGINTNDIFLAKYDPAGNFLWAKDFGGTGIDLGYSVCTDATGNVFLTGTYASTTITFGSTTLTNAGTSNVFIAKLDMNGNSIWAKSGTGSGHDEGQSVSADGAGNIFLTGFFKSPTITFGTSSLSNASSSGSSDVFILKYDSNGNVLWGKRAGGTSNEYGYTVRTDAAGNLFLGGGFLSSSITFDSISLTLPSGNCLGACDPMFLALFDPNGNALCASDLVSGGDDEMGLAVDQNDNVFVGGDFMANPFVVGSDTFTLSGIENEDLFLAKYNCGVTTSANEISQPKNISVFPNPSNGFFVLNSKINNGNITIYNSIGKIIYESQFSNPVSEIDLSDKPNGIYFVIIKTEKDSFTQKIIISH